MSGGRFPGDLELAGVERQLLAGQTIEGAGECPHIHRWPHRSRGLGVEKLVRASDTGPASAEFRSVPSAPRLTEAPLARGASAAAGVLDGGNVAGDASSAGGGSGAGDLTAGFATAAIGARGTGSGEGRGASTGGAVGAPPLVPRAIEAARSSG